MTENEIHVEPFSAAAFIQTVQQAGGGIVTRQVEYLAAYLEALRVVTVVRETRYIDRHYMDEYALFYSRMLNPPSNTVTRLHFFEKKFDSTALNRWMRDAMRAKDLTKTIAKEAGRYHGFCCVRPIPESPIGRTVIARWPDDARPREIYAIGAHPVHIGNLEFKVVGLPFQQQEAAVGACATASVWSALSRVARHDGMRAPTPAEIALAVERAPNAMRAPLAPTTGLTIDQVFDAIQAFGFTPAAVSGERPEILALALHTYLQSGIPVVMILRGGGRAHAVTATGFQLSGTDHPKLEPPIPTRSMQFHKLYVHDDRIGPYARSTVTPYEVRNVDTMPELEGLRFEIEIDGAAERWIVETIVAPVYPKIRLSIGSLLGVATAMQPMIEKAVGADAFKLRADLRYVRSGEYLPSLARRVSATGGADLASRIAMSRWCAVARWFIGGEPVVEFVYDTTDILRGNGDNLLLAIVVLATRFRRTFYRIADRRRIPRA
ncbi:MAG TPA: hypothetical protein VGM90_18535 [Kofleriaceae bacterium]